MIDFLIGLILLIIVLGVLYWAIFEKLLPLIPLPVWAKVILEVIVILVVVFIVIKVIIALLGMLGIHPVSFVHL